MTKERYGEGWAVDKLRMVNQIKLKHRKWTPEITGTIDRGKYNSTVIGPYGHEPLHLICLLSTPRNPFPDVHGRSRRSPPNAPLCLHWLQTAFPRFGNESVFARASEIPHISCRLPGGRAYFGMNMNTLWSDQSRPLTLRCIPLRQDGEWWFLIPTAQLHWTLCGEMLQVEERVWASTKLASRV